MHSGHDRSNASDERGEAHQGQAEAEKSTEIVRRWLSGHSLCEVMVLDGCDTTEVLVVS